jgi:hypothetical protein
MRRVRALDSRATTDAGGNRDQDMVEAAVVLSGSAAREGREADQATLEGTEVVFGRMVKGLANR